VDIPVSEGNKAAIVEGTAPAPQRKRRLGNLLNSPILLVVLILTTIGLAFRWYSLQASLEAARRAPMLSGWSWTAHPNSLLIFYPHTDCGCGPGLSAVLTQASTKPYEVAIVSDVQGPKLDSIVQEAEYYHVHLLAPITPKAMARWCRDGNTTLLHIRKGRVVGSVEGTIIPESFFKDLK
jgi:hypothetical protein